MEINEKWDKRFLEMAELVSNWSKDPSTKIGCVITNDRKIVLSIGYNGFPRNIPDLEEHLNNREIKYKYTVHAEMNAIYNAAYNGISLDNTTIFTSGLPTCSNCALGIIQSGIKRVVWSCPANISNTWGESRKKSLDLFKAAKIEVKEYITQ